MSARSPCGILCINIQTGRLHVEPTAGLLAADIARVPLITARRPVMAGQSGVGVAVQIAPELVICA